jgi:hypothetical protein
MMDVNFATNFENIVPVSVSSHPLSAAVKAHAGRCTTEARQDFFV